MARTKDREMGKQNRQRRAQKMRQKARAGTRPTGDAPPPGAAPGRDDLEASLHDALAGTMGAARHDRRDGRLDEALDRFERVALRSGFATVPTLMADAVAAELHDAWHRGWHPADLLRAIGRHHGDAAAELAALAIIDEADGWAHLAVPPTWSRQVDELRDGAVGAVRAAGVPDRVEWLSGGPHPDAARRRAALRTGAFLVVALSVLPTIAPLGPEPCAWPVRSAASDRRTRSRADAALDPGLLAKVRALLAKAESTTFEPEAMALTAKAQELISKHSIDAALLAADAHGADADAERPEGRRVGIDDPYASEKSTLLAIIADANRCQSVWSKGLGFSTVFGFAADVDAVELLFTSLLVQATTAMVAAGSQRDQYGRSRTRSFRQSFLVGYGFRIGERLRTAADHAAETASAEWGGSILPVLVAREEQVDEVFREAFPHTTTSRARVTNGAGYAAGQVAADQARLGPDVAVTS